MSEPINVTVTALTESVQVTGASSNTVTLTNGGGVTIKTGSVGVGDTLVTAGTVQIGNVTLLPAGSSPTVKNTGTSIASVLDFGIPAGPATNVTVGSTTTLTPGSKATVTSTADGGTLTLSFGVPAGENGSNGANGSTPSISIGTVTTLTAGSGATVTASTTKTGDVLLDFGIPRGDTGATGSNGVNGTTVSLSNANPMNLGSATPGTSTLVSRADHVHNVPTISQISGLQTALDGKQPTGSYLTKAVESLNNLTGNLTLAAGGNVTITPSGSTLTIAAAGGGVAWSNVPLCPTSSGVAGQIARDTDGYLYVCTETNVWKRTLLTAWACVPPLSNVQFFDQSVIGTISGAFEVAPWGEVTVPGSPSQVQTWLIGQGGAGSSTEAGGGGGVIWTSRAYTGQTIQYRFRTEYFGNAYLQYTEVRIGNEAWSAYNGGYLGSVSSGGPTGGTTTNSHMYNGANGAVSSGVFWGGAAGASGSSSTPTGCRMPMPDRDSVRAALALVPKKSAEDCGATPAAGSGGYYSPAYGGSVVNLSPGYGGGGGYNQQGGPGAILFVFS